MHDPSLWSPLILTSLLKICKGSWIRWSLNPFLVLQLYSLFQLKQTKTKTKFFWKYALVRPNSPGQFLGCLSLTVSGRWIYGRKSWAVQFVCRVLWIPFVKAVGPPQRGLFALSSHSSCLFSSFILYPAKENAVRFACASDANALQTGYSRD